jgi:hypothetical protein
MLTQDITNTVIEDDCHTAETTVPLAIAGCDLPVTPPPLIKEELTKLIGDYYLETDRDLHPFEATCTNLGKTNLSVTSPEKRTRDSIISLRKMRFNIC